MEHWEEFGALVARAIPILKAKHGADWLRSMRRQMPGGTFYLFLGYLYLTPKGEGPAFGGKPIRDSDIADQFGRSVATVRRWRNTLALHGYIDQHRTPDGWLITLKSSRDANPSKSGHVLH